jgi:hypothetical protein
MVPVMMMGLQSSPDDTQLKGADAAESYEVVSKYD